MEAWATDLLAAAEDEGGHPYALLCLLGTERASRVGGVRCGRQRGRRFALPGDPVRDRQGRQASEVVSSPRTQQPSMPSSPPGTHGPLLLNESGNRLMPHNAAAIVRRLAGIGWDHASRDAPRAATVLHHGRTAPGRTAPRDATRRSPHQGRHDGRLRPVRTVLPPQPHVHPDGGHRAVTAADSMGQRNTSPVMGG